MKLFHKFYTSHSDELKKFGTTIFSLTAGPHQTYPFELYLYFRYVYDCVYIFVSLWTVLFVAHTFC